MKLKYNYMNEIVEINIILLFENYFVTEQIIKSNNEDHIIAGPYKTEQEAIIFAKKVYQDNSK